MSFFSQEPTRHDFFTSLAALKISRIYPDSIVECLDGGVPFDDLVANSSPILNGYRPDAILQIDEKVLLVEVKSFADLFSEHTLQQLEIIRDILNSSSQFLLYLLVFDCPAQPFSIPALSGLPMQKVSIEIVRSRNS